MKVEISEIKLMNKDNILSHSVQAKWCPCVLATFLFNSNLFTLFTNLLWKFQPKTQNGNLKNIHLLI